MCAQTLKKTPLYSNHVARGAKMVPFAGYSMPVSFEKMLDEHHHVRRHAGLFDVSHMARLHFRGSGALAFAQKMTVNNVEKLKDGRVQYSVLCNEQGRAIDDLTVYRFNADHFMFIVNGSRRETVIEWLKPHLTADVDFADTTDDMALIAFQGRQAQTIIKRLTDVDVDNMRNFSFVHTTLCGQRVFLGRTGYTGEDGFEIEVDAKHAEAVWNGLIDSDADVVKPIGLGARDTLRLEMGYMLYGNDLDEETTPIEAGLNWVVKVDGDDFIGKSALVEQKRNGVKKTLVGIKSNRRAIPRRGYEIHADGQCVGKVTSGSISPVLNLGIGLAYVEPAVADRDGAQMVLRGKPVDIDFVKPPFIKIEK